MKKLSERFKGWLWHRQRYEQKRAGNKLNTIRMMNSEQDVRAKFVRSLITTPAILCLDRNKEETVRFLESFKRTLSSTRYRHRQARRSKRRLATIGWVGKYHDFRKIQHISTAVATIVAAECERFQTINKKKMFVADIDQWNGEVFAVLFEIGFFDLVVFDGALPETRDDVGIKILPIQSGDTTDPELVRDFQQKLRGLYPSSGDDSETPLLALYGAMIEAVGNAVTHAYPADFHQDPANKSIRRWWMTGAVNGDQRSMTTVVFDQGATIPVTLPSWRSNLGWVKRLQLSIGDAIQAAVAAANPLYDGHAIAAAVEESVTSTYLPQHGHGLAQMRDFVDNCRDGYLRIASRCGEVVYKTGQKPLIFNHKVPIGGTLIEWNVSL